MDVPAKIPVTLRAFRYPLCFLVSIALGLVLLWSLTLYIDSQNGFPMLGQYGLIYYLTNSLFYQSFYEIISFAIFMKVADWYIHLLPLNRITLTLHDILLYELRFFPCVLIAILLLSPVTNGIKYLVIYYPQYSWESYFPTFIFNVRMFDKYLILFFLFGYLYLNTNLLLDYTKWQSRQLVLEVKPDILPQPYMKAIEAWDEQGETILSVQDIMYFETESQSYFAYTKGRTYNIRKNLSVLETELNPQHFFRINRSVILNLSFIKNYTFWKNDKYIIGLNDSKTEFIMQRSRLKDLKERLPDSPPPE
ncbi:LytTR family DNA-binding domain-containing protein [Runella slithyformis]|uniref:Response regulator receiver protein n=1 Tax=Runella slithyformis (strain ATCC 29530 / DSM 19594 / LMG 11500 / NCIMB 11436 / LSU 4) TaxID=761193 RepID=A0A7U3ZQE7_RUNSL|nr:LytTR family DNA-binding domain-containing protein [Runella slithyformis]AEI51462.1 response regulator receiver protein [Runella slithyformis DSM 19594]